MGRYGDFDRLCYDTLIKLKERYGNIKLVFITPYLDVNYGKFKNADPVNILKIKLLVGLLI